MHRADTVRFVPITDTITVALGVAVSVVPAASIPATVAFSEATVAVTAATAAMPAFAVLFSFLRLFPYPLSRHVGALSPSSGGGTLRESNEQTIVPCDGHTCKHAYRRKGKKMNKKSLAFLEILLKAIRREMGKNR